MKSTISRLRRWEYACLCLLIIANLAIHFSIINSPPKAVLDEEYYIADAQQILQQHITLRTEHPPLGKLLITLNVALLGDNPAGWRTLPILFSVANIVLLYLICRRLGMSWKAANLAAFLLAFENLSFVQGSLAMLDVFSLTFMLLSFWFYLRGNYPFSAVSVALATLAKLSGVFAILIILAHWLIVRRNKKTYFALSMSLAPISFLLLMVPLQFAIYHRLTNLVFDIELMLSRSAMLTFAYVHHPYASRPWEWLITPMVMPYFYGPHYFGAISFTLWALIIPAFLYMVFLAVRKNEAALFSSLWFAGTYLIWIPLTLITDRVTYVYYFYPAVGAVCMGLGVGLSQMVDFWQKKQAGKLRWAAIVFVVFFLVMHAAVFITLAPVNPWPVERMLVPLM